MNPVEVTVSIPCPDNKPGCCVNHFRRVLVYGEREIPDYLTDLNAMHEAEKAVFGEEITAWSYYESAVSGIFIRENKPWRPLLSATASQRAEALLKTLNLWTES
jgi:hypothetical protein